MTLTQEDALYDFLDITTNPFSIQEVVAAVLSQDASLKRNLERDILAFLQDRRLAFPMNDGRWLSRCGYFQNGYFLITPSRLEIQNGILIPGHRCVPFANPLLLPHEYTLYWNGEALPYTTTEGAPEDFYPYYSIFGEEYAPQYIARDNPQNESLYNQDPYEEPTEVSIHTLDMRSFYRETGLLPGQSLLVQLKNWKLGYFEIVSVTVEPPTQEHAHTWITALDRGFSQSFTTIGPGSSTEEQVAFAYWFAGSDILHNPAYALETYLYEKTNIVDVVPYGMESRFWFVGKEIPDGSTDTTVTGPPDKTELEELLYDYGIPVSEYVVQSYIRDVLAFPPEEKDSSVPFELPPQQRLIWAVLYRLVPAPIQLEEQDLLFVFQYIQEVLLEIQRTYNPFADLPLATVRHSAAEFHTALIEQMARLSRSPIEMEWLPKHTFIVLSQLQFHTAHILEELDTDGGLLDVELESLEISLDGMLDTYQEVRQRIEEALEEGRKQRLSLVKPEKERFSLVKETSGSVVSAVVFQASLRGTDVWRRFVVPRDCSLGLLHRILTILFDWSGKLWYSFVIDGMVYTEKPNEGGCTVHTTGIDYLLKENIRELVYDYGEDSPWEIHLRMMYELTLSPEESPFQCLLGEKASPPEHIGGPLRFRRFLAALGGSDTERRLARHELGDTFNPELFERERYNRQLETLMQK
ncbi:MAG: plasmid pRiA4b ORF-3 family protein [Treponemataceae bacterium]|nr:plasmid pRiA4b ORF-3 family protein [Treponemataceae bacterium]